MNDTTENTAANTGRMVDNAITVRDFMTKKEAQIFGAQHEPGHVLWLGQIIGTVRSAKEKMVAQPGGEMTRSVEFEGYCESFVYHADQKKSAPSVYLPHAISNELEMVLGAEQKANPAATVSFAIEVGIEATGKTIPYAWRVRAFHKQTVDPLADIRAMIPPPSKKVVTLNAPTTAPMIEGEKSPPVTETESPKEKTASKKSA
jgi:hypothetical protein